MPVTWKPITAREVGLLLGDAPVIGDPQAVATRPGTLDNPEPGTILFCSREDAASRVFVAMLPSSIVIASAAIGAGLRLPEGRAVVISPSPRLDFSRVLRALSGTPVPSGEIHPTAIIHPSCAMGYAVRVEAGCILGEAGFSYERREDGAWESLMQVGGLVIGDEVEIRSGTRIDRGTIEDTVIGDGCKIDAQCYIAHNVRAGRNCVIHARAVLLGRVVLDDDVFIGAGAMIREGIRIGRAAKIGMGSVVTKDIPPGATAYGVPARVRSPVVDVSERRRKSG